MSSDGRGGGEIISVTGGAGGNAADGMSDAGFPLSRGRADGRRLRVPPFLSGPQRLDPTNHMLTVSIKKLSLIQWLVRMPAKLNLTETTTNHVLGHCIPAG
jgi:hypothetical protein